MTTTTMQMQKATRQDPTLSQVITITKKGWPSSVPEGLKPFWEHRNELTTLNDCLMWGIRIVVPAKLQERVLQELHVGHPGASKMKAVARSYLWWPGLSSALNRKPKPVPVARK